MLRLVWIHAECGHGVAPNGYRPFLQGCGDVHQAGVAGQQGFSLRNACCGGAKRQFAAQVQGTVRKTPFNASHNAGIIAVAQKYQRQTAFLRHSLKRFRRNLLGCVTAPDRHSNIFFWQDKFVQLMGIRLINTEHQPFTIVFYAKTLNSAEISVHNVQAWHQVPFEEHKQQLAEIQFWETAVRHMQPPADTM